VRFYSDFRVFISAQHNKEGDLWIVVDSRVYDLSKFAAMHPGGLSVLLGADVGMQISSPDDRLELMFALQPERMRQKSFSRCTDKRC
jgi:hypothetical protein